MGRLNPHQSVFDLIREQPGESAECRALIEACEAGCGRRLPEAMRRWYLVGEWYSLWCDYSNQDPPEPLESVLAQFARDGGGPPWWAGDRLWVLDENQGVVLWYALLDGSEDPPVYVEPNYDSPLYPDGTDPPKRVADSFSAFLFDWFAGNYFEPWTPLSERSSSRHLRKRPRREKPYLNGLWLYAPDADAVAPPYLDFLMENLEEDSRGEIAEGVVQYEYHSGHGRLRVTTDDAREPGGKAAWWLHADSEEGLLALAKSVLWCGDVGRKFRHWSKAARPVMDRLRADQAESAHAGTEGPK